MGSENTKDGRKHLTKREWLDEWIEAGARTQEAT